MYTFKSLKDAALDSRDSANFSVNVVFKVHLYHELAVLHVCDCRAACWEALLPYEYDISKE